jgi:hypothetical protein
MQTNPFELARINRRNQEFWLEQSELLTRRMSDETLYKIAMHDISEDAVPVKWMKSLERVFAHAEVSRAIFQAAFSRKGGKVSKADALQCVIEELVNGQPKIAARQLICTLRKMAKEHPVIVKVDQQASLLASKTAKVYFEDNGEQTAPVSGLKDRLYRAKKKILSR